MDSIPSSKLADVYNDWATVADTHPHFAECDFCRSNGRVDRLCVVRTARQRKITEARRSLAWAVTEQLATKEGFTCLYDGQLRVNGNTFNLSIDIEKGAVTVQAPFVYRLGRSKRVKLTSIDKIVTFIVERCTALAARDAAQTEQQQRRNVVKAYMQQCADAYSDTFEIEPAYPSLRTKDRSIVVEPKYGMDVEITVRCDAAQLGVYLDHLRRAHTEVANG